MRRATWLTAVLLSVSLASTASAAPIFYSSVHASVTTFPNSNVDDALETQFNVTSLGPLTATATDDISGGTGWATAWVDDGTLHAYATSNGDAFAEGYANFVDTLLLTSNTLADGELVQLSVALDFTRTLTGGCGSGAAASASLDASTGDQFLIWDSSCVGQDVNNGAGFITAAIGDEIGINAALFAIAAGLGVPNTADATNTLRLFLTPLGDFTYTTVSGLSYVQTNAVPEPATIALLGLGLAGVSTRRWRRRQEASRLRLSLTRSSARIPETSADAYASSPVRTRTRS